ncbi:hypothetical protein P154DRAFT_581858 [Amniculicola lignicola CBS 123094]|uniref:Uncharacterized protein n=1 Tax=Amniculicola lignicola CBS 123094 TaxID=1392246 RepID=A0A6A5VXA8_9PLEO|nr:hypothetical protein P154DRAFT_581858 [Amniculicola lignicola CBS 123094]
MAISLLDLPLELFQDILRHAINSRSRETKRIMRLRLVCSESGPKCQALVSDRNNIEAFSKEVVECLIVFKLLDGHHRLHTPVFPDCRAPFLPSYIEHHVWTEPDNGLALLVILRKLAEHFSDINAPEGDPHHVRAIVKRLSAFVAEKGELRTIFKKGKRPLCPTDSENKIHLFAAAVILEDFTLVKELLAKGHNFCQRSILFGSVTRLPMLYNDLEMLKPYMCDENNRIRRGYYASLIVGAARIGNVCAFKFFLEFHAQEKPWLFQLEDMRGWKRDVWWGTINTRKWEIWEHITELTDKYPSVSFYTPISATRALESCARFGEIEMAQYLLNIGADVNGRGCTDPSVERRPIVRACERGHLKMVRLLLDHGAKATGTIAVAAYGGYMEIVRMLLDHGVDPDESYIAKGAYHPPEDEVGRPYPPALVSALKLEHTALFEFLLERGATLTPEIGTHCNTVLVLIRDISGRLSRESATGLVNREEVDAHVKALCTLAMQENNFWDVLGPNENKSNQIFNEDKLSAHDFAAAIRFSMISVVKKHLIQKNGQYIRSSLFGHPDALAAKHCDLEMIELFVTHGSHGVQLHRLWAFSSVAEAGQVDMSNPKGKTHLLDDRAFKTSSVEIWKFYSGLTKDIPCNPWKKHDQLSRLLSLVSSLGWVDMVCHLISEGAPIDGQDEVRGGHFLFSPHPGIVRILMQNNANVEGLPRAEAYRGYSHILKTLTVDHGTNTVGTVAAAAMGGYIDIVRMLVGFAADVNETAGVDEYIFMGPHALVSAVKLEQTALFKLLVESGGKGLDGAVSKKCMKVAKQDGLTSGAPGCLSRYYKFRGRTKC